MTKNIKIIHKKVYNQNVWSHANVRKMLMKNVRKFPITVFCVSVYRKNPEITLYHV